jgi:acetyl esterase/lipase
MLISFLCLLMTFAAADIPKSVTTDRDITYASVEDKDLKLDVYWHPESSEPMPLVVWIHGGAWRKGNKETPRALPILEKGYALASIQYRLTTEAIFPAQIHDCKAAIRWLRKNASRYNIDPNRIGVWGPSAGGHLVALLGTSGDVPELEGALGVTDVSSRVQAVCDWFGPTDLLRMNDIHGNIDHDAPDSPESQLIGAPIQANPDLAARANPITYVSSDDPPFLIMHGARDFTVIKHQSELLHTALQKTGVSSNLIIIDDQGHGFNARNRNRDHIFRHVEAFFDRELKKQSSSWTSYADNPHPWVTDFGRNVPGSRDVLLYSDRISGYTAYTIYLPPTYTEEKQAVYPTVYWLHGRNGRTHGANRFITRAHKAIQAGLCPEFVIVAPAGLQSSMYVDAKSGSYPVESVIIEDLIPHIEATYKVSPERMMRAIDGFSMGGYGAAHIGFKYPDLFGSISLMGAAIHRPEFLRDERADIFADAFGGDLAYCVQESPWTLVKESADRLRGRTTMRLFVGASDTRLREKNVEFSDLMNELDLAHEHGVVANAAHSTAQVIDGMGDGAWTFYRRAFERK